MELIAEARGYLAEPTTWRNWPLNPISSEANPWC